jgi:hypothetical protein
MSEKSLSWFGCWMLDSAAVVNASGSIVQVTPEKRLTPGVGRVTINPTDEL